MSIEEKIGYFSKMIKALDGIWLFGGPRVPLSGNAGMQESDVAERLPRQIFKNYYYYYLFQFFFSFQEFFKKIEKKNLTSGTARGTGLKRPSPCPNPM